MCLHKEGIIQPIPAEELEEFLPPFKEIDKRHVLIRNGYKIEEFENGVGRFKDDSIDVNIVDCGHFAEFVNEYKGENTKIFYDSAKIQAVFDYGSGADVADWRKRKATLEMMPTFQFREFAGIINKKVSHQDFVMSMKKLYPHISMRDSKVTDIAFADILETLSATRKVVSTEKNHERGAIISVEIKSGKDNKDLRLPEKILITIPVYRNDEEITAAFECELYSTTNDSGGIILQMYCYDYENVVQDAVDRLVTKIITGIKDVKAYSVKSV